jgi:hypothetical protein
MAWHLTFAADLASFVHDANRGLFERDVQTDIVSHAALLHLMQ